MLGKTKNPGGQSAPQKNKYLVIALLCLPFVLCLYLIFGGSGEQKGLFRQAAAIDYLGDSPPPRSAG